MLFGPCSAYVGSEDPTITLIANLLFWAVMADMLWRMATSEQGQGRGGGGGGGGGEGRVGRRVSKVRSPGSTVRMVPFDTVVVKVHAPRE